MNEKVIIIDDERMILDLTVMVLQHRGYQTFAVDNAVDGYAVIEREQPAIALLDYMMPQVNGMVALREIRRRFPSTYVIMFTGKGSEEIAVELMKAGAADYILKPFSNANLVERIEAVMRLRSIELHNLELLEERERLLAEIESWNRELERRVEVKTMELEAAHAEILQNEKLAALGQLSAGMAHEIRNPLNAISLFAQVLKTGVSSDLELASYTEKILQEVDRIDNLLIKLLASSKRSPYQLRSINLRELLTSILSGFTAQCEMQCVEVCTEFDSKSPAILADADELTQIFSNLIANALFEMRNGGRLGIHLAHDDQSATVVVSDTGKGIAPENLGKIFDPFFTTKEKGTGFGLSVALRIVKSYGGRIKVESEPGAGCRISVNLPLS